MTYRGLTAILLVGCLWINTTMAGDVADDHRIGQMGDDVLMAAAEIEGDLEAWWDIGVAYRDGIGVKIDLKKALYWLEKAANRNYDGACVSLGDMYYHGQGVKQDYKKAFELYNRGLRRRSPDAQYRIGLCLYLGKGTKMDKALAVSWFQKAAAQIEPNSQYMLGVCYENGEGVKKDLQKAREFYRQAAESKHEKAAAALQRLK